MSDDQVATNGAPAVDSTPAQPNAESQPAPSVDVEAVRKAARLEAQREANAAAQRREAQLHKTYQSQLKELRETVRNPLQKAGYEPDAVLDDFDVRQKARQYDELTREAQQAAEWQAYSDSVATAYGLAPTDPRLAGATSAQDLAEKAKAAMLDDAAKERDKALADARKAATAAAQAKVDNGDLDVLGGAPPAAPAGLDERYKKEMLAARGQPMGKISAIRDKYRQQGLDVDHIRLG